MKIGNWKLTKLVFWFVMEKISGWPTGCLMKIHEFFLKRTVKAALDLMNAQERAQQALDAEFIKDCSFLFKKD